MNRRASVDCNLWRNHECGVLFKFVLIFSSIGHNDSSRRCENRSYVDVIYYFDLDCAWDYTLPAHLGNVKPRIFS